MFVTVKFRALLVSCAAAALCVATQAVPGVSGKPKTLSAKDARRLIAALPGLELKTSAVNVKGVSGDGASAEAAVGVRTAFRFARGEGDKWLVREVRVGDRKWEDVPLLAAALKTGPETSAAFLSDLEALAAEVEALLRQAKEGGPAPTGVNQAGKNRGDEFIIRGPFAVPVNSLSGLLSSATVEAEVATNFRFAKDARNRWRVAGVRVGAGEWRDFGALVSAVNDEKIARARAEMGTVRAALEEFRRARGFYVAADDHAALIDHLSPRYLTRVVRVDPWHNAYRYEGTGERYTLSSDGADGKAATADDVTLGNR